MLRHPNHKYFPAKPSQRLSATYFSSRAYLRMEKEGNKDDNEYLKSERTVCDYFGVPLLHKEVAKFAAELKRYVHVHI